MERVPHGVPTNVSKQGSMGPHPNSFQNFLPGITPVATSMTSIVIAPAHSCPLRLKSFHFLNDFFTASVSQSGVAATLLAGQVTPQGYSLAERPEAIALATHGDTEVGAGRRAVCGFAATRIGCSAT